MTTRRERLERRADRRREWADKAATRSTASLNSAHDAVAGIPFGQPILIGHHSEKRHRAAIKRQDQCMRRGVDEADKATDHNNKADGIDRQLRTSIFSDDADAVEALEVKIERLEAQRTHAKTVNAAWRKAKKPDANDKIGWAKVAEILGTTLDKLQEARMNQARDFCDRGPYPAYIGQNLSGNIKRCRDRLKDVQRRQERADAATEAGGVIVEGQGDYCTVTFAEKPSRDTLGSLRAAEFHWSGGSWTGRRAHLPECIEESQ